MCPGETREGPGGGVEMKKQINFTDIEYGKRKRKTRREEFLECMNEITKGRDSRNNQTVLL